MKKVLMLSIGLALLGTQCSPDENLNKNTCSGNIQYLGFQLFASGMTEPIGDYQGLGPFLTKEQMEIFFKAVQTKVGNSDVPCRRTAVIIGPIALDFSNSEIATLIDQSFELANQYDIAIGFHIDDGMFWANRNDLWQNPDNVEWIDWNETSNTSRYVDWVQNRLAPLMCFNAPEVKEAVRDFTTNIAIVIKSNLDKLTLAKREYLYAGTIIGWETSLDKDRDTQQSSGYHALFNKGYDSDNLPANIDQERVEILREYIEWMADPFMAAGLPVSKTYSHVAFLPRKNYDYAVSINPDFGKQSYAEVNSFSIPEVANGKNYTPGFTTYPQAVVLEQIHDLVGNSSWASAEAANIIPSNPPVSSGYAMESYLARHFNYRCSLLNIFAFNIKGNDPFIKALNDASEGTEAITAYKKFLAGDKLKE